MPSRVVLMGSALAGPLVAAAAVVPFRDTVANTSAALLLVIVVVAVAAGGDRLAGLLAALSAGLWFDVFLTRPYGSPFVEARADIETAVLLVVVGLAVTELAVRGQRQQARAARAEGRVEGIEQAVAAVTEDAPPGVVVEQVTEQVRRLLNAERCRFDFGAGRIGGSHPRLRRDGEVEIEGALCDVPRFGLPTGQDLEIVLTSAGDYLGRFVVTAGRDARPSLAQRLTAVTLADRAAAVLATHRTPRAGQRAPGRP